MGGGMSGIVNPMDALPSFQRCVSIGEIELLPGLADKSVGVHMDNPDGTRPRYTYARLDAGRVTALGMATYAGAEKGKHFLQIAYAVPEDLRGHGRAKDIARATIEELRRGLGASGLKSFYVEAVMGLDNIASQRVAAAVLGGEPKQITDAKSGEPALQYKKLIQASNRRAG